MFVERLKPLWLRLAVAMTSVAILGALGAPVLTSEGQAQEEDDPRLAPIPQVDVPQFAQSVVAIVQFSDGGDAEFIDAAVSLAPPPARVGGPPLIRVDALDAGGAIIESYDEWNPLWAAVHGSHEDGGEDEHFVQIEDSAPGRFIVRFAPELETVKLTDIQDPGAPVVVGEFDVHRAIVGYCVGNASDPGCQTVCIGDVDRDGDVTIRDLIRVAFAFGSTDGEPRWNPDADLDQDGIVDWRDVLIVIDALRSGGCV